MDPQRTIKIHKAAEWFWLGIVVVSTLITLYWWMTGELADRKFAIVLPFIALLWYLFRRFMRKRLEKQFGQEGN